MGRERESSINESRLSNNMGREKASFDRGRLSSENP
jgi:hypothetical protein